MTETTTRTVAIDLAPTPTDAILLAISVANRPHALGLFDLQEVESAFGTRWTTDREAAAKEIRAVVRAVITAIRENED